MTKKEFYKKLKECTEEKIMFIRYGNGDMRDYKWYTIDEARKKKLKLYNALKSVDDFDCHRMNIYCEVME